MNIHEIEKHWFLLHGDSLKTSKALLKNKQYVHSMFFLHLSMEQLIKSIYVKNRKKEPPFSHNLQFLLIEITGANIPEEKLSSLIRVNSFQIAGRYDDYKNTFRKMCTRKFASEQQKICKELMIWLKSIKPS